MLSTGHTTREIGAQLKLTSKTVSTYWCADSEKAQRQERRGAGAAHAAAQPQHAVALKNTGFGPAV
jgi:hypothetical protein